MYNQNTLSKEIRQLKKENVEMNFKLKFNEERIKILERYIDKKEGEEK